MPSAFRAGGWQGRPASPGPRGCDGLLSRGRGWGTSGRHGERWVQDLGEAASGPGCGGKRQPAWGQEAGGERPFQTFMAQWGDEGPLGKTPRILGPVASGSVEISRTISMVQNVDVNI